MTIEEAIELLDHKTQAEALKKAGGGWFGVAEMNKALEMAVDALRAQQTPLDRSMWEGCCYCQGTRWLGGQICGEIHSLKGRPEVNFKTEGMLSFLYCPRCGRPLTEEAWAELVRRINGGKTDMEA